MKLADLDPEFVRHVVGGGLLRVPTLAEADGLLFVCPKCWEANAGPVGTHSILIWTNRAPADAEPTPARWSLAGSGLDDVTVHPSIRLVGGCAWHGWITHGGTHDA